METVIVAGEVLQQIDGDVEADDVRLVLIGKNLAEKCAADFFLHVDDVALATAGIDHHAQSQRQVGLGREVLDGLRLAVFVYLEVIFLEVGNQPAVLLLDVEEQLDHVDVNLKCGRRFLGIRRLLAARGWLLTLGGGRRSVLLSHGKWCCRHQRRHTQKH